MYTQETRGYLLGKTKEGNFAIPDKLMDKISVRTSDTVLMIWHSNKMNLKILNVENDKVTKIKVLFETITQTIFAEYLTPLLEQFADQLIHNTGVQFPKDIDGDAFIEYYIVGPESPEITQIMDKIRNIEGVRSVESLNLSRYTGE